MKTKIVIYIVVLTCLNILLTVLTLKDIYRWDDMALSIVIVSYSLLLYSIIFFGYRRYTNLLFNISLILSFTLYSYTESVYYSDYHDGFIFYSDFPNNEIIIANMLIGLISTGMLLLLSKIRNKYISKYFQVFAEIATVSMMLLLLHFVFFTDM
ncbi:MAG: hypothetical protein QM489_00030 [Candidatus Izemoplasma sp.]